MQVRVLQSGVARARRQVAIGGGALGALMALGEVAAVSALSVASGAVWHLIAYGHAGDLQLLAGIGMLTGLLYVLPFLFASDYRADRFLAGHRTLARIFNVWTYVFFVLGALAFLTKTTGGASRGWLALFFILGGATVVATDALLRAIICRLIGSGLVKPRRLFLVGTGEAIRTFEAEHAMRETGIEIVESAHVAPLGEGDAATTEIDAAIGQALEAARNASVQDVLVLTGDSDRPRLGMRLAERFMELPVTVHLGQLPFASQFPRVQVAQIGRSRTLALANAPLDPFQRALKRALDVVGAIVGLILLAPLLVIVAVMIKLDSPGPVFFRQRRHGFNQRQFRIWKFRTMTTLDDGVHVPQAVADDPRATRIGRVLRRYNIDEMPQLLNVLVGQMSLVGPRPHAIAHDKYYERVIRRYPRRLNVKPGITGWAQVNGFRGLTETEHAMRSRLAHDLYYIDNWSIALDIYIILMTVVSPKAFRNAG